MNCAVIVDAVASNGGHLGSNPRSNSQLRCTEFLSHQPMPFCGIPGTRHTCTNCSPADRRNSMNSAEPTASRVTPHEKRAATTSVENSHASTILSYAYGLAVGRDAGTTDHRHIVAVIGDGAMTGGMSFEALNNLGHSKRRVIIVLNDNGRSYAPTVSNLWANAQEEGERSSHPSFTDRITSSLSSAPPTFA